jgi:hypothetical protein
MSARIGTASWALLALLSCPAAHALDAAGAKQVIDKFLASQSAPQADPQAVQHVVGDINGDGKPDIVLMWNLLGPTYFHPKLTLFLDQGRTYRTLTTDLNGQTEKLTVQGPDIVVDTLMLGPNDPRCCPTRKTQMRFRWQGGKLVGLR